MIQTCSEMTFCKVVDAYREDYHTALSVLTFLIGFYVTAILSRWWQQVTQLPEIEELAIHLNALIKAGIIITSNLLSILRRYTCLQDLIALS